MRNSIATLLPLTLGHNMSEAQLALFPQPDYTPELIMDPHSYVYLMASPTDPTLVKIGTTCNLARRQAELGCRVLWYQAGGRHYERWLHRRFASSRLPRTEWFRLDADIAAYFRLRLQGPMAA